ncbi:MAG: hypothetical protein DBP02_12760 [gamma proteobacterium symbiont of Ctena orbiculata]|nr:MAG: hypothetical protein DBP02_12760 [gamma proteobacterium symbiont of Ctena orbiculata]
MKSYLDKRIGMGPIPSEPKYYLKKEQVNGLAVLRKFGWRIVCIRRPSVFDTTTILLNKHTNKLGVLGSDGILRLTNNIKIRDNSKEKRTTDRKKTQPLQFRKTLR